MKEILAALEGMLLGVPTYFLFGNVIAALCVALITGAAGYAGQQIAKWIHKKLK